ncbi:hypothetical protein ILUMI_06926 [Ignelater luminosus]|uniref:Uncharacterized protein n=1 Tax=Ignelater luminosus TaxID=2038154 RepID=A0A8K0GC36_IGNLU|nr:hypothetical protein ILUMI_06926 [Ignelater luminosus]
MHRMVLADENQRSLQKIFWCSSPERRLQEYTQNTVTYGTKLAPVLAIRCLRQFGLNHLESCSKAAQTISHDFYVHNLPSGADTQAEAIELFNKVRSILKSGCFELRKSISNDSQVIQHIPLNNIDFCKLQFGEEEQHPMLGLMWDCKDNLLINIKLNFYCLIKLPNALY